MKEAMTNYCVVEISSFKVRMVYGYVLNNKPYILHAAEVNTDGVKNGIVDNPDSVGECIKLLKQEIENKVKVSIDTCTLIVPPSRLKCLRNTDSTNTVSPSNIITWVDIKNVLSKVSKVNLASDYKIINVVPYLYSLDDVKHVKHPLNEMASELKVHASIYALKESLLDNYKDAFFNTGIIVSDVVVSPLCAAFYISTLELPSHYFLLNIGEGIMTFSLIHQDLEVIQSGCYQFGGRYISFDIADRLQVSFETAENYKKLYGISRDPNFEYKIEGKYDVSLIGEVIKDSFSKFTGELKKNTVEWLKEESHNIPVLLTGGCAKIKGLKEYLAKELGLEVFTPVIKTLGARNPSYINLIGAICYKNYYDENVESAVLNMHNENNNSLNLNREE